MQTSMEFTEDELQMILEALAYGIDALSGKGRKANEWANAAVDLADRIVAHQKEQGAESA